MNNFREECAARAKAHPIFGTDFSKPLSELIAAARHDISTVRGRLDDIGAAFPGWKERLECVEGLLTCGLIALHAVREEMLTVESTTPPQDKPTGEKV